jgi:oligosaccharyltransferase complex subunit delta (ribophorin II)
LSDHVPLSTPVELGQTDTLKIILTATENGKAKRPHQAFLLLRDQDNGLETSFPLTLKDSGKGKVDFVSTNLDHVSAHIANLPHRVKKISQSSFSPPPNLSEPLFSLHRSVHHKDSATMFST